MRERPLVTSATTRRFQISRPFLLLILLALALASVGGSARPAQRQTGVFVINTGLRVGFPTPEGFYLVTREGRVRRFLSARWVPVARSRTGSVAAFLRGKKDSPLFIVTGKHAVAVARSARATCVAWSPSGQMLSYIVGRWRSYDTQLGPVAGAYAGTLSVVRRSHPSEQTIIEAGLFPSAECPAWSKQNAELAYVVARDIDHPAWTLRVSAGRGSTTIAPLSRSVPSIGYRTFDWAPDRNELTFANGRELYRWSAGSPRQLGQRDSLRPLEASDSPYAQFPHSLRYSPNGRFIAVCHPGRTGIFRADGTTLAVVQGTMNGWAGSAGVLTLAVEADVISLRLHRLTGTSKLIAKPFKSQVVTDPAGRWFAYGYDFTLTFRAPDGTLIRSVHMPFVPQLVTGLAKDGRLSEPASAY